MDKANSNTKNRVLLSHEKTLTFVTTWMDPEGVTLTERSQRKRNIQCFYSDVESTKVRFR